MPVRTMVLTTVIIMAVLAHAASAQDIPRVGISMGYPGTIGVIWQVTGAVALRPEISIQKSSGESTDFISFGVSAGESLDRSTIDASSRSDLWQVTVGVSALFYLSKHDALRTYLSPRWAYSRMSNNTVSSLSDLRNFGSTASSQFISGSFGGQYALGRRFGAFGEVGLSFSRIVTSPDDQAMALFGNSRNVSRSFNTRSAAGVILYF
jgi:hypothetical protein